MRKCGAVPYEGDEKFIFVSYCHKDSEEVFPIIEQMVRDGYRVWYDEGINPGNDWPEIIADHLSRCSVCIAFISEKSIDSHDCGREINFALLKKKPFFSVYLEEVELSAGLEMQLTSTQSIFKYKYSDFDSFMKTLYKGNGLNDCRYGSVEGANIGSLAQNSNKERPKKSRAWLRTLLIVIPSALVCCGLAAAIIVFSSDTEIQQNTEPTESVTSDEVVTVQPATIFVYGHFNPDYAYNESDFVFPESSMRKLSRDEISKTISGMKGAPVSDSLAQDAINEIYARNGYVFKTQSIKQYYESKLWYSADSNFELENLNTYEKYNIALLEEFDK